MSLRTFLLAAAAPLLISCAATQAERASKVPIGSAARATHGFILASVGTQRDAPFSLATIWVRPRGQGSRDLAEDLKSRPHLHRMYLTYRSDSRESTDLGSNTIQTLFSDAKESGVVLLGALPAGEYEMFSYGFDWRNFSGSAKAFVSVPFTVRAGEIVYLGRHIARLTEVTTEPGLIFDTSRPGRAYFEVRDAAATDKAIIKGAGALVSEFHFSDARLPACRTASIFRCLQR